MLQARRAQQATNQPTTEHWAERNMYIFEHNVRMMLLWCLWNSFCMQNQLVPSFLSDDHRCGPPNWFIHQLLVPIFAPSSPPLLSFSLSLSPPLTHIIIHEDNTQIVPRPLFAGRILLAEVVASFSDWSACTTYTHEIKEAHHSRPNTDCSRRYLSVSSHRCCYLAQAHFAFFFCILHSAASIKLIFLHSKAPKIWFNGSDNLFAEICNYGPRQFIHSNTHNTYNIHAHEINATAKWMLTHCESLWLWQRWCCWQRCWR